MLTAFATVDNAIYALKEGASDFIKKPFENEHLIHIVHQCLEKYRTLKEREKLEEDVKRLSITDDLTGELVIKSAHGLSQDVVKNTRIRPGDRIAGWVAEALTPREIVAELDRSGRVCTAGRCLRRQVWDPG
jgi:DNA-binding response OmpR family regulator